MFKLLLLLAILATSHSQDQDSYPIITTKNGQVRGAQESSRDGRPYYAFLGIPYGKFQRFETSTPAEPWDKLVLDATRPGPICYQKTFHTQEITGVEDCLVLNVYTPKLATATDQDPGQLPVLVFVHGGGFWSGTSTMYNPTYLMDEDVVIVTVNYRLGPFGFFNLGIKEAPGNQGLKDVVLSLKWVRDNIGAFNGDSKKITVFGESAGGAIVSALVISPISQGLFNNAIIQSGPGTGEYFTNKRPKYYALLLAEKVGCRNQKPSTAENNESYRQIVECLKKVDKEDLLNALNPMRPDYENEVECAEPQYNFSVEDLIEGEEAALPHNPRYLVTMGNFTRVPIIIGVNKYETHDWVVGLLSSDETRNQLNQKWNRVAPIPLLYYHYGDQSGNDKNNKKRDELSARIREFYFQNAELKTDKESIENFEHLLSDRMENCPTREFAQILAARGTPTYLYMFDKKMTGKEISPQHAEELNYLFTIPPPDGVSPPIDTTSPDYAFSKNLIRLWVSFAAEGKPTHIWGSGDQAWNPLELGSDPKWYHLDDDRLESRAEDDGFRSRMEFWKGVEQEIATQPKDKPSLPTIKIEGLSIKKKKKDEL